MKILKAIWWFIGGGFALDYAKMQTMISQVGYKIYEVEDGKIVEVGRPK